MNQSPPKRGARSFRPATQLVHGGGTRSPFGETSEALYLTQGYVFDSMEACEARFKGDDPGFVYSRYGNPTVAMFEERMALLEGAEAARATATGMAAVTAALMSQVRAGDHVVAARALFGACRYIAEDLLPRYGVGSTLVDGADLDQWRAAMRPETKVVFLESPTNPCLDVYDIEAIAAIAHEGGALVVVDNVFATPILQKPLTLGADLVVYSATKHIDGGGRCLGGVILGRKDLIEGDLQQFLRQTGPALSPFNAWVLLKALETLSLRVERQSQSAGRIADFLGAHPNVSLVRYPGRADHPHAGARQAADVGRRHACRFRNFWWQASRFRLCAGAAAHQDFQQSWRRQEPHHPSGDDNAPAADARGARVARRNGGHGAAVGRA